MREKDSKRDHFISKLLFRLCVCVFCSVKVESYARCYIPNVENATDFIPPNRRVHGE